MTRFQRLASLLAALLLAWVATALSLRQRTDVSDVVKGFAAFAPLIVLVLVGVGTLGMLLHGVATFRTVPEEAAALRAEIEEAHQFLRKRGVATA